MHKQGKARSPIDDAAQRLRDWALGEADGTLLGNEDDLIARLGVSRVTVRQAARLLEREGVLNVRRGINGGYFASRPSVDMVETVVCAYLDTLGLDTRHTGGVATALWMETLRQAANADRAEAGVLVDRLVRELHELGLDATLEQVAAFEKSSRSAIFRLIRGSYIEVFFGINAAFSYQQVTSQFEEGVPSSPQPHHARFVERWRKAKLMELEAIAEGDEMLAMMTALHTRKVWIDRGSAAWRGAVGTDAEKPGRG